MEQAEAIALLEARTDLVVVGRRPVAECIAAVQRSLPTMEHAAQLVEQVVVELGARGYDDPDHAMGHRVFARDREDPRLTGSCGN